jgi:hypothetical protein
MVLPINHSCEVRRKLAEEFSTAARLYAEIVVNLAVSGITQADYTRLRKAAEEAQNRSQAASAAFEEHVDLHRCFDGKVVQITSQRRQEAPRG